MTAARRRTREEREPQILAAARELLETRGLVGTSVAEVAARVGVSEATVFNYFPTRRDLMFRVISDWMTPVIDRLETDLHRIEGVRARLGFLVERHFRDMAAVPGMHRLIYRELHWEDYYGTTLHALNQRYSGLIVWIVNEGKRGGTLVDEADPELVRDMIFGALHHIGWRTLMNDRSLDIVAATDGIVDQILRGIARQSLRAI